MKKCTWIETTLNIRPHTLQPCCRIHAGVIPEFPYDQNALDIEGYKKFIVGVYKEIQGISSFCSGCNQIDRHGSPHSIAEPENFRFSQVLLNIHENYCNCKCIYCGQAVSLEDPPGSNLVALTKQILCSNSITQDCVFDWGGGETSIVKEFTQAAQLIADAGYRQHIFTNSIHFNEMIQKLLSQGQCRITTSLDASSREVFRRMKRCDMFDSVVGHIKKYLDASKNKQSVLVKYIITDENCSVEETERFLDICENIGIRIVLISPDFNRDETFSISERTQAAARSMFESAKKRKCFDWCGPFYSQPFKELSDAIFRGAQ